MAGPDRSLADIDAEWLRRVVAGLDLDGDPARLLADVNCIGGRVAALRAYARRQIADRKARAGGRSRD